MTTLKQSRMSTEHPRQSRRRRQRWVVDWPNPLCSEWAVVSHHCTAAQRQRLVVVVTGQVD